MSYARYSEKDSECYVILSDNYQCLGCRITGEPAENGLRYGFYTTEDPFQMTVHLRDHRAQGFLVPQRAIERLYEDAGIFVSHLTDDDDDDIVVQ